jgi:hypothetical protein
MAEKLATSPDSVVFPMMRLTRGSIILNASQYETTAGVRLGEENFWMSFVYFLEDGICSVVELSCILDSTPEFCGGALLRGVSIIPGEILDLNRHRKSRAPYIMKYSSGYKLESNAHYPSMFHSAVQHERERLIQTIDNNRCPFPSLNALLGEEYVSREDATKYAIKVLASQIVASMCQARRRVLFAADKAGGCLQAVMKELSATRAKTHIVAFPLGLFPRMQVRSISGIECEDTSALNSYDFPNTAKVSVRASRPLRNYNSGNMCTNYVATLTINSERSSSSRESLDRSIVAEVERLCNTRSDICRRDGSRYTIAQELKLYFPHYIQPGYSLT